MRALMASNSVRLIRPTSSSLRISCSLRSATPSPASTATLMDDASCSVSVPSMVSDCSASRVALAVPGKKW